MSADPRMSTRYTLAKPVETHRRPATCEEAGCRYFREGWQMRTMPGTPVGERQEALIKESGRRYIRHQDSASTLLWTFEAGQRCFGSHTVPMDRPALYVVRQGNSSPQLHSRPEHWVEDFSTHLDKIREQ